MNEILRNLRLPTSSLQLEHFQATLNFSQKIKNTLRDDELQLFLKESSALLWEHSNGVLSTTECQLMCSTCFFTLLALYDGIEALLKNVEGVISSHHIAKTEDKLISRRDTLITISLIYGMYQSTFISSVKANNTVERLLEHSFLILIHSAYDYSEFTFITFKTLHSVHKLLHSNYKHILLNNEKQKALLKLTIHNWENPITGVRDLNQMIFGLYLDMNRSVNDAEFSYEELTMEINSFPWNKAKYLMLSETIVRESKSASSLFESNSDWLSGIMKSLTSSSVSAGADMYFAVLKKINSDTEWCNIFLDAVLNVFNGSEFKTLENFNNYWCMNTLKKFPNVLEVLTENLKNLESENSLYAYLSVLRQGNKLGMLNKVWIDSEHPESTENDAVNFSQKIKQGLEHINVKIRIQTFEIVCIAHNNAFPTEAELSLILKFLQDNVNSDSTVLRLSMLNNIKLFFRRLHISAMNVVKNNKKERNEEMSAFIKFCTSVQWFLKSNLKMQGNYQRNITIMKLCEIFLSSFTKPMQRKRKPNITNENEFKLKPQLVKNGSWLLNDEDFIERLLTFYNDPAEDVRETVSNILLNNYVEFMNSPSKLQKLFESSMKNIQSKFFYEVSSGHCGLRLLCNFLVKLKLDNFRFNTIEELFQYFFNDLYSQMNYETDILTSIETGKPLHSIICVLQNILEVCLLNSHPLDKMLTDYVKSILVEKLGEIPKCYILEEGTACSPDFSEMNDIVEQIISHSVSKVTVEDEDVKISDLHQIVLNCVWLNLKACCDLLCVLVKCVNQDDDLDHCDKCLQIITNISETSRHKGAIEAAGIALGKCVKHLTSLPRHLSVSRLPMKLLKGKLEDLMCDNKMGSVTRRGAGLSIMLHRIVSNDMDKEKPLFHYAIKILLQASSTRESEVNGDDGNEKDIPKAIFIHLMTKVVADSSLASDVMYYSASLAEIAFSNITSEHWQIRNAALQLYGALIPKLIGQKKASSGCGDSAATVGCDELRSHSPKLWAYIEKQLDSQNDHHDIVLAHSNLVPTLNILASVAEKYNFSFVASEHTESDRKLFFNLMKLLNSPIYTIRRLTAKSIQLMYPVHTICDFILDIRNVSENMLHGLLLLVKFCKNHLFNDDKLFKLKQYFNRIIEKREGSYVVKNEYNELFWNANTNIVETLKTSIEMLTKNKNIPGVFVWVNTIIENCIKNCANTDIPAVIKLLLNMSDFEIYCSFILKRIKTDKEMPQDVLKEISVVLTEYEKKFEYGGIWKILYNICYNNGNVTFDQDFIEVVDYLKSHNYNIPHKIRYIIPFIAKIHITCFTKKTTCDVIQFSCLVLALTDSKAEVDMRYMATLANNILGSSISILPLSVQVNVLKSALNLLQDDDEDIRLAAANFYSNVTKNKFVYQPFICLQKVLNYEFLHTILTDNVSEFIEELSESTVDTNKIKEDKSYNPFLIETRNIYAEPHVFSHYVLWLKMNDKF